MAELRTLDPDGSALLVQRVLATYRRTLGKLLEEMRQSLAVGDWKSVSRVAHTLKSSSASIGALAFSRFCAEIEALLHADDRAAATPLLARFETEAARVDVAVDRAMSQLEAAPR